MANDVHACLERAFEGLGVGDVHLLERRLLRNVLPAPGREVVDNQHVVAPGQEGIRHVRPHESGSSGYENLRHRAREYAPPQPLARLEEPYPGAEEVSF